MYISALPSRHTLKLAGSSMQKNGFLHGRHNSGVINKSPDRVGVASGDEGGDGIGAGVPGPRRVGHH